MIGALGEYKAVCLDCNGEMAFDTRRELSVWVIGHRREHPGHMITTRTDPGRDTR